MGAKHSQKHACCTTRTRAKVYVVQQNKCKEERQTKLVCFHNVLHCQWDSEYLSSDLSLSWIHPQYQVYEIVLLCKRWQGDVIFYSTVQLSHEHELFQEHLGLRGGYFLGFQLKSTKLQTLHANFLTFRIVGKFSTLKRFLVRPFSSLCGAF